MLEGNIKGFCRFPGNKKAAAPCCFLPAHTTTYSQWLAGNHTERRFPHNCAVFIRNPGHHLGIGCHVGGGNISFRTEERTKRPHIATGQFFFFLMGHRIGIAENSALTAAERHIDE